MSEPITATEQRRSRRIRELDALRGIAALCVVLFHYTTQYDREFGHTRKIAVGFPYGLHGVELFFVISGFVIFMTLERTARPLDFLVSRASRLYPAYWAAIALTFAVTHLAGLPGKEVGVATAAINLTMLQMFLHVQPVDGVYWTLAVELAFYAAMFGLFLVKALRRVEPICAAWLGLVALRAVAVQTGRDAPEMVVRLLNLDYGNYFVAGLIVYLVRRTGFTPFRHALLLLCALIPAVFVSVEQAISAGIVIAVFYLFAYDRLEVLAVKPLLALGTISYTLYLIHQYVGYVAIRELEGRGLHPYAAIAATLATVILAATVLTVAVEQPALRLVRGLYRRRVESPVRSTVIEPERRLV